MSTAADQHGKPPEPSWPRRAVNTALIYLGVRPDPKMAALSTRDRVKSIMASSAAALAVALIWRLVSR